MLCFDSPLASGSRDPKLSLTIRPVVLLVKSFFDRWRRRPGDRRIMGKRRLPLLTFSVACVRQRALLACSSQRSCAERDFGLLGYSVKAAATT